MKMKSRRIWIQQAMYLVGIVFMCGAVITALEFLMGKQNCLESALYFMSLYGLVMGPALDPSIFRNPVAIALSMGETRKGICRGLQLTRVIYNAGIMLLVILTVIVNPFPDVSAWIILTGYLGVFLTVSAISAMVSAFTYQRGSNIIWLRLLEGIICALHIIFLLQFADSLLICTAVLAEGIVLTFVAASVEKKVFLKWNYHV